MVASNYETLHVKIAVLSGLKHYQKNSAPPTCNGIRYGITTNYIMKDKFLQIHTRAYKTAITSGLEAVDGNC